MVRPAGTANMSYPANATTSLTKVVAKTCHTTGLEVSEGEDRQVGATQLYSQKAGMTEYSQEGIVCVRVNTRDVHAPTHARG